MRPTAQKSTRPIAAAQTIAANIALNFPIANPLQRSALIGTGLMLFVISLAVNVVARFIVARTGTRRGKKRNAVPFPPTDAVSITAADDAAISPVRSSSERSEGAPA